MAADTHSFDKMIKKLNLVNNQTELNQLREKYNIPPLQGTPSPFIVELPEDRGIDGLLHPEHNRNPFIVQSEYMLEPSPPSADTMVMTPSRENYSMTFQMSPFMQQMLWGESVQIIKIKPIQWDMLKILDHKCWKCQHWNFGSYNNYQCNLNHHHNWYGSNWVFPRKVTWNTIHSKDIIQKENIVLFAECQTTEQEYNIEECPCYTESQDYHDWKAQQPFFKVKSSQISL